MTPNVETRVRAANPIVDREELDRLFGDDASHRLLCDSSKGRVVVMADTKRNKDQHVAPLGATPGVRRGWLAAAGSVIAGLLILGVVAITGGGTTSDVATAPAPPTAAAPPTTAAATTTILAPNDPVDVIASSIDAYNAGDLEGWLDHFSEGAVVFGRQKTMAADLFGPLLAASSHLELTEECALGEPAVPGAAEVTCTIAETNDFHGAGGITVVTMTTFLVNDDSLIGAARPPGFGYDERRRFNSLFWRWLDSAHPEVHEEIELASAALGSDGTVGRTPDTPENMRIALDYVDEFVAQSDEFPVGDGS